MVSSSTAAQRPSPVGKSATEFQSVALLLQGGGALGAYQGGVYQALHEKGIEPDWIGGISIGAFNGAIIAGNRPENRVEKLRGFWEYLTQNPFRDPFSAFAPFMQYAGEAARGYWNQLSAGLSAASGVPGFFTPHAVPPWLAPAGSPYATSYYDTGGLKRTLQRFVDFDLLNSDGVRYTTSAVNVTTGNFTIFDSREEAIRPEHVMASGALPPALPAVEIGGEHFWDGGLISNTPLRWVMDEATKDTLVFQVDLWSSRGEFPKDIMEVMTREKEIRYSSRTRAMTDRFKLAHHMRHAFAQLYEKLPEELKKTDEAQMLYGASDDSLYNIVHLIYRTKDYEGYSKDYEFSRLSMEEHWKAGYKDTVRSLKHGEVLKLPTCAEGIMAYDITET